MNGHYVKAIWHHDSGYYMHGDQTIKLSEPVSAQRAGIVLHWQAYLDGIARDYWHNYLFVPKWHVEAHPGAGVSMIFDCSSSLVIKYVYVGDVQITGNDANSDDAYNVQGMTLNNQRLVLTDVLGV